MASLYKKVINGKPYWYLREMAWVAGKPTMVSERYLGSGADIAAARIRVNRSAAVVFHHVWNPSFEHGATTRLHAANAR